MTTSTESLQSLSLIDKTAMFLDRYEPIHQSSFGMYLGLVAGAGAGYGMEHFLVNDLFVNNHRYEAIQAQIEPIQANRANLIQEQSIPLRQMV